MRSLIPGAGSSAGEDAPDADAFRAPVRDGRARPPRSIPTARSAFEDRTEPEGPSWPLQRYLDVLRAQWLVIVITLAIVTSGVALGDALKEPVYLASGTIEIRKQAAEVVPVEAVFQFERISDQYLQTQYAMLRSPTLVRRTLSDSALRARLESTQSAEFKARDEKSRLASMIDRVVRRLVVEPITGSRIVQVTFEWNEPDHAAQLVNALIAQYIAMREEAGAAALERFAEQADSVRADILHAEFYLQQFVRDNGLGVVVGPSGELEIVPQERLRRLEQELTQAETDGFRAEALYDASREKAEAIDSDLLKTLRVRIAELQGEYSRLRSAFTDSYPRARQVRSELDQLDSLVVREQERVALSMGGQRRASQRRRDLLRAAVSEQRLVMDNLAAKQAEYERLKRDLDGQKQLYAVLQQKRKESAVAAALASTEVAVLDGATPAGAPISPVPERDIPVGAVAGLMLGIVLAFLRVYADPTVRTLDEVEVLSNAPVLALIPSVRVLKGSAALSSPATQLAAGGKRYSLDCLAEAFRGLRTSMLFESNGPLSQLLLVTSGAPGEGKTFVSTNLALSLASLGRRVLLIDADLRRPAVHRAFRLTVKSELSKCLSGAVPWQAAVSRDVVPGLDILASRTVTRSASDLLSSAALHKLLTEARSAYDFVLIDAPALFINVPDARILAQMVDGVVLVVRSGATPRDLVRRLLAHTPNVVGVVLNGYDLRQLPASYADYGQTAVNRS